MLHTDRAPTTTDAARGARSVIVAALWAVVVVAVVFTQLPPSAIGVPGEETLRPPIRALATQGWAFFTKSPREANVIALQHSDGQWRSAMLAPHSEPRNIFGLDRASRAQGVELGLIVGALRAGDWVDCFDNALQACADTLPTSDVVTIVSSMPAPTLCGAVVVARSEPTPWAWAADEPDSMPLSLAEVEVRCS